MATSASESALPPLDVGVVVVVTGPSVTTGAEVTVDAVPFVVVGPVTTVVPLTVTDAVLAGALDVAVLGLGEGMLAAQDVVAAPEFDQAV